MPLPHRCTQLSSQAFQPAHRDSVSLRHKLKVSNSDSTERNTQTLKWNGNSKLSGFSARPLLKHRHSLRPATSHALQATKAFTHLRKQNKGASPTHTQTARFLGKHGINQPRYFTDRCWPPNCSDTRLSAQSSRSTAPCPETCHPAKITTQSHQPRAMAAGELAQPVSPSANPVFCRNPCWRYRQSCSTQTAQGPPVLELQTTGRNITQAEKNKRHLPFLTGFHTGGGKTT